MAVTDDVSMLRGQASAYPQACLPALFRERVVSAPEQTAVSWSQDALSYAELDERSTVLARHLLTLGIGPERLVGICLERSGELVVAALGVLKARGAYVPVDPDFPVARQQLMFEDSGVEVVITQESLLGQLPTGDYHVICLDRDWPLITRAPQARLTPGHRDELAYVLYTSGSTGRPKGVEITHRSLVNFLWAMREQPGLSADDVLVAVTTLSFDIAALELFLPLVTGARIVIATAVELRDPALFRALIERSEASVLQATPLRWQGLVETGWRAPPGFKGLVGGEALPVALADELTSAGVELWNMYGPTETTIWSTCTRIQPGAPITIGRPIANTSVYILDEGKAPVPAGSVGELWIGGDGVARGYRDRPELNAERFVADPFSPGERMYRTGDLARLRPDGDLDFLGRADHQVKVRGYRIELGEIETALTRHPAVSRAVVVAAEDHAGYQRLVAYFIPEPGATAPAPAQLRAHLARSLPDHMVPAVYVELGAFPQTPNGKIDRKALPEPPPARRTPPEAPPETELQQELAGIWRQLLGVDAVSLDDDFFDLGGHSLLALQLTQAIEEQLGQPCTMGMVFESSTLRALAARLQAASYENTEPVVLELARGEGESLFCLAGVSFYQKLAERLSPEFSTYGIFLPVEQQLFADRRRRGVSMEELAADYVAAIRGAQPEGPYNLLGFCFGGLVAYEAAQQLRRAGEEVDRLVMIDTVPQDVFAPPLRRIKMWARARLDALCERLPGGVARSLRGEQWLADASRLDRARTRVYAGAERKYAQEPYGGTTILVQPQASITVTGLRLPDSTWGWSRWTPALSVCQVAGAHTTVFHEPHVDALAATLRERLAEASQRPAAALGSSGRW